MKNKEEKPKKRRAIHQTDDDPVVEWAENIAAETKYGNEESFQFFLELKDQYKRLLKHFTQVTRLSDSYSSSLKELTEKLNEQIRMDILTHIPNRRGMMERLDTQVSRASRYNEQFSLILADIDHFKQINDEYGHQTGDTVLIEVAKQLNDSLRKDDYCSRWGGEEFLICLPHTNIEGAQAVAEKLRSRIANLEVKHNNYSVQVTISLGVTEYHKDQSLDDIVRIADDAMYQAKQHGRNQVFPL